MANRARWNGVSLMTGGFRYSWWLAGVVAAAIKHCRANNSEPCQLVLWCQNTAVTGCEGTAGGNRRHLQCDGLQISVEVGGQWFSAQNVVPAGANIYPLQLLIPLQPSHLGCCSCDGRTSAATFQSALQVLVLPLGGNKRPLWPNQRRQAVVLHR